MANTLYDLGRKRFLEGQFNWLSDTIKCDLVKTTGGYTVSVATHEYWADVSPSARVPLSPVTLGSKATTGGAADAADVTFSSVAGDTIGAIILYKDTGVQETSPLIAYIDTATGLPITPNGGDIIVTWDNG